MSKAVTFDKNLSKTRKKRDSEFWLRTIVVTVLILANIVFLIIPVIIALVGSFHQWNPLKGQFNFLGFDNYANIFQSGLFWKSMWNTTIFTAFAVVFRIAIGLALAYAIYSKLIKHKSVYRTLFYMPTVTPLVAVAFVWKFMYNPQIGIVNQVLGTDINWLLDSSTALGSIIAMTIWKDFGYAVILFLAGLYSLPKDCFEAASIDGARADQVFLHITLPLLKPTMLFVVITSMISYLQTYIPVMVMTKGGPGTETYLASYIIFDQAFIKYNFGYASALSFIIFAVIAILTAASFKVTADKA